MNSASFSAFVRFLCLLGAIGISALGADLSPSVTPETKEVGASQTSYTLKVNSNKEWTAATDATWVAVSPQSGSREAEVVVTVAANKSGADRTAKIVLDGQTHALTQLAAAAAVVQSAQSSYVTATASTPY